jgi:hypothetical protein
MSRLYACARTGAPIAIAGSIGAQPDEVPMKKLLALGLLMSLTACATCKHSDSPEVCRTKERDHSQPRLDFALAASVIPRLAALSLRIL